MSRCGRLAGGWIRLFLVVSVAAGGAGCAGTAERMAEGAAPAAVRAGLQELAQPKSRALLGEVVAELPIEEISRQAARGATAGVVEAGLALGEVEGGVGGGAADPAVAEERVRRLLEPYAAAATRMAMDVAEREALPRVRGWVDEIVREAVASALHDEARADLREAGAAMGSGIGSATATTLAAGFRDEIGPAIAEMVKRDLTPAIVEAVREELPRALADLDTSRLAEVSADASRLIAREAVYGMNDATVELAQAEREGERTMVGQAEDAMGTGIQTAYIIAGALGLLVIGLAVGLGWVLLKMRGTRRPEPGAV